MTDESDRQDIDEFVRDRIRASTEVSHATMALAPAIAEAAALIARAYAGGHKCIFFGNGGSAADAQHLAAEMECRFLVDRRPLPALALHANSSTLTAISNDYAYDPVFARLLRAHARPGDVAIAISTSGSSANVLAAARLCRELELGLVALTGERRGELAELADVALAVPSQSTPRIQEAHILIGHILCEWTERELVESDDRG